MIVMAPTVRHTGSQWLKAILHEALPQYHIREDPTHIAEGFILDHTYDTHIPYFKRWLDFTDLIVIPLRHPKSVARSWSRDDIDLQAHWKEMWENLLMFWVNTRVPVLTIPVDQGDHTLPLMALYGQLQTLDEHGSLYERIVASSELVVNKGKKPVDENNVPEWEWLMNFPKIKELYA